MLLTNLTLLLVFQVGLFCGGTFAGFVVNFAHYREMTRAARLKRQVRAHREALFKAECLLKDIDRAGDTKC